MITFRALGSLVRRLAVLWIVLAVQGCGGGDSPNDKKVDQAPTVDIVADPGLIVAVRVGEVATLDGSKSTVSSDTPLTYAWSFTDKPKGSQAELTNAFSATPSFTGDVVGSYRVQLVVSADGVSSERAIALVEVSEPGSDLTGIRVHIRYSSQCADCHDGRYNQTTRPDEPVRGKSPDHLATSNICQACHTTFGFEIIHVVDHDETVGKCSGCHNGVRVIGKSQFHRETNAECGDCHNTKAFLALGADGKYDHTGIKHDCARCHNGRLAPGKQEGHFITEADCGYCHTTNNFKSAFVDHSSIRENCASCHDGDHARGMTKGHPVMAVDCSVCHSTSTFNRDGVFNHRLVDASVQSCASCHNGNNSINAKGKPNNHVVTSADCGVCHGVAGKSFKNAVFDHSTTSAACASCHGAKNAQGELIASGKSINHMPTTLDCGVCHTPGNFATGTFDHDFSPYGSSVNCLTCHDNIISVGKLRNHIPTVPDNQNCGDCHGTDTFKGAVFSHNNITASCATCHDGIIAKGKKLNHLPTNRDCSDCHVVGQYDSFAGATFDHLDTAGTCARCHDGIIALGKKDKHIPAQTECSQCHTDTRPTGFKNSIFLSAVHVKMVSGCEGCHNKNYFPVGSNVLKGSGHIPTAQDCHFCHTNDSFANIIFNHAGITADCTSCHNGQYAASAGALGKPTNHPATNSDCGVCHGIGSNFKEVFIFDHTGRVDNCNECHGDGAPTANQNGDGIGAFTKKNVGHITTNQDCSICHVPGSFATAVFNHGNIVGNCVECHDGPNATGTVKSKNHIVTSDDCSVCHNTTAFAGAKFDHLGVTRDCTVCHNGTIALGKKQNHVPTNDDCSKCHYTTGFVPATFDHAGIVNNCRLCHDGIIALGKNKGHIQTSQDCGDCHVTSDFKTAAVDHATLTPTTRCDSCHGNPQVPKALPKNSGHLTTSLDCRACHTTVTFVGGTWVHDSSTKGVCDTCHKPGGGAKAKPQGHLSTTAQCDECHSTTAWVPSTFKHDPAGAYPGDHRRKPACSACHGSTISNVIPYPSPTYKPYCAACHAGDFRRVGEHNGGKNGTVEQNKDCSGGGRGCHKVTSSGF